MLLLIDNYDSFAYNLYQLAGAFSPDVMVERNDALTADEAAALAPEAIFLSPGPGRPLRGEDTDIRRLPRNAGHLLRARRARILRKDAHARQGFENFARG